MLGLSAHCTHDEIARIATADGSRQTGVAKLVNNAVAAAGRQSMLTTSSYYYYCDAVSPSAETGT